MSKKLFLVITVGRTGSTYFTQWLNGFENIRCHEELLNTSNTKDSIYYFWNKNLFRKVLRNIFGDSREEFKKNSVTRFLITSFLRNLIYNKNHSAPWDNYENRNSFFRQTDLDRNAQNVGLKFIPHDIEFFGNVLREIPFIKESKIIYLRRKNLLASHVSFIKAQSSGFYHTSSNTVAKNKIAKVIVPTDDLIEQLTKLKGSETYLYNFFPDNEHKIVYYEEFFSGDENYRNEIINFLSSSKSHQVQSPTLKKTSSKRLKDNIENFEQVKECLKGSEFEVYLND